MPRACDQPTTKSPPERRAELIHRYETISNFSLISFLHVHADYLLEWVGVGSPPGEEERKTNSLED
jgi:hypothetical protein